VIFSLQHKNNKQASTPRHQNVCLWTSRQTTEKRNASRHLLLTAKTAVEKQKQCTLTRPFVSEQCESSMTFTCVRTISIYTRGIHWTIVGSWTLIDICKETNTISLNFSSASENSVD